MHRWMQHRFGVEDTSPPKFRWACRARQFGSFLVIGRLLGLINLILSMRLLYSTRMSCRFLCWQIRCPPQTNSRMQSLRCLGNSTSLPKTLALCSYPRSQRDTTQKAQLEKLLGIPDTGLTKEIQFTQDIMSLSIDYEIPSDMLTYEGPSDSQAAE